MEKEGHKVSLRSLNVVDCHNNTDCFLEEGIHDFIIIKIPLAGKGKRGENLIVIIDEGFQVGIPQIKKILAEGLNGLKTNGPLGGP